MKETLRRFGAWLGSLVDARDIAAGAGLVLLGYGGELLLAGAGYAAAGAVLVAIAVFVR